MSKLLIGRVCGWGLEQPEAGTYVALAVQQAIKTPGVTEVDCTVMKKARIHMARNIIVATAQDRGFSHLLMLDPDMDPDAYVGKDPLAERFLPSALAFMQKHSGPCICAAPYRGGQPSYNTHVFVRSKSGDVARLPSEAAASLSGWWAVEGVGTGLMLISMDVFERLQKPYFEDYWADDSQTELRQSQDARFCLKARHAGIPVYVNFSAWSAHFQMERVGKPGWVEPEPPAAPTLIIDQGVKA